MHDVYMYHFIKRKERKKKEIKKIKQLNNKNIQLTCTTLFVFINECEICYPVSHKIPSLSQIMVFYDCYIQFSLLSMLILYSNYLLCTTSRMY